MTPLLLSLTTLSTAAQAQETIDIGVVKDSDISVVQKLIYTKDGRSELGLHVGIMPFDAFTTTPLAAFTWGMHQSETMGWELKVGGGYGLKNASQRLLESPAYATSPDSYRYLASALVDVQWSPIYAKANWRGTQVFHHDMYLLGGGGLSVEQAVLPDHTMAIAPTLTAGLGARVFLNENAALRIQLADDVLAEHRAKTADIQAIYIKQNCAVTVGYVRLSKKKEG